jgi:TolB-like protein/Tfp pilus assembly protein PilF
MGVDEVGTLRALKAIRVELADPAIAAHHGRIVKTTGDGILIEFPSVVDAVACAVAIQEGMVTRNAGVPEDRQIIFRIGINIGDIIIDEADILGDGVNVAARLETLADPGGICISAAAHDQVRGKVDVAFEDMGEQSLKNIARPVRAYSIEVGRPSQRSTVKRASRARLATFGAALIALVATAAAAVWLVLAGRAPPAVTTGQSTPPPFSVVVLPFQSVAHDPRQEAFADGLTEDLTNVLGHISGSFVIASSTARTHKGKPIDVRQIGRDLGVRYALEGTVLTLGDDVRVDAQLIDAETGGQMWADQFNGDIAKLADLHDDVRNRIARALDLKLLTEEGHRSERQPDNRDAVALTFQGRGVVMRGLSPQGVAEARKLFDQALAASPDYAPALVFRALIDIQDVAFFGASIPLDAAEKRLLRALEKEPDDLMANFMAASLYTTKGDVEKAAFFAEKTIAIDPSYPNVYWLLSYIRRGQGRAEEGIALNEKAIRLSPRDPFVDLFYRDLGLTYLFLGREREAVPWLEKAVATNDKVWPHHAYLASAYALIGRMEAAHKEVEVVERLSPGQTVAKRVAAMNRLSSNETYRKQVDHVVSGLRAAGMPE